jgi:putative radical SAM enzyme (TIGR03279 family)
MRIVRIQSGSPAARAGVRAGDELLAVNRQELRDALDYLYASVEGRLLLRLRRADGGIEEVRVTRAPGEAPGIEFAPDPVRRCGNRCIFCFVDQNPKGLRPNLYVKDEDYRLSLLYGNYVTLTNLREWEIRRILEQRLSPLYVSVHAVDPAVRRRLLGCRGAGEILPLLGRLAAGGIRLHAQIVLVPGVNDGAVLEQTLDALEALHPALQSVAIVPVGLTRHREGLPPIRRVTPRLAGAVVRAIEERHGRNRERRGTRLHYPADEFYLLAGISLPPLSAYEDLPQLENGVGMLRRFERELHSLRRVLPPAPGRRGHAAVATGARFAPIMKTWLVRRLRETGEAAKWRAEVVAVRNRLYGARVNVAGLLGGAEVVAALRRRLPFDLAIIPPEMLNAEGLTLDGWRLAEIALRLGRPVRVGFGRRAAVAS